MTEPNWEEAFVRLEEFTRESIGKFKPENPDTVVSDFWYEAAL